MLKSGRRFITLALVLVVSDVCKQPRRVDAATTEPHTATQLHVTVLGRPNDSRLPSVREALAHWNREFNRLGHHVQFDSGSVRNNPVSDKTLGEASSEAVLGFGFATSRLRASLKGVAGDIMLVLSDTALISFGIPWRAGSQGIVVIRRSDVLPLSLPNTVRNVVAHELGHALGLSHNQDSTTLMCGRPSPCRPALFASDTVRFFPLTAADEQRLRERWP